MLSTALLGLSLILCHQVTFVHSLAEEDKDDICTPFNKTSGLVGICGYDNTVKFAIANDENQYAYERYLGYRFGNCTKTVRQLLCAQRFPRCFPGVEGPFLPCRRVIIDTLLRCGEELRESFANEYWWLRWYVDLLPENNDPTTTNFKKRCYEPSNFNTDAREEDLKPNKCFSLVVPACQNHGYKMTIFPEKEQIERSYGLVGKNATNKCEDMTSRWYCTNMFPPCYNESKNFGSICNEMCHEYVKNNCTSMIRGVTKESCERYPKGPSSGYCKVKEWLFVDQWPGALTNDKSSSVKQKASSVLTSGGLLITFAVMLFLC